ncbi:MAG TPA: hypothetical protein VFO76_11215 [Candidatus Kapabacteria bacterium]|nr:hypothetical protein [Candidatus Kapabacteria bacterium]
MKKVLPNLALGMVLLIIASTLYAQTPRSFSYQGLLLDASKNPVTGVHQVVVNLYESALEGSSIHSETFMPKFDNGVFSITIGSQTALEADVKFDKQYWLGVSIDGSAELPRTALNSVPYAINSQTAQMATSLAPNATGAVTALNGKSGAIEIKGGEGTTVTANGNTITITAMPTVLDKKTDPQANSNGNVSTIIGTANQIFANGTTGSNNKQTGDVTLTLPQNINTGATPTFAGMTLSSLPSGSSGTNIVVNNGGVLETRTMSSLVPGSNSEPFLTFSSASGLSNNRVVAAGAGIGITNSGTPNGNYTIANTGVLTATGTANQINVSSSTGNVTFSLPQNINTAANPTFNNLTLTGKATSAATTGADASTTLTTKGYVDAGLAANTAAINAEITNRTNAVNAEAAARIAGDTGPAGGDLTGNYPNPTIGTNKVTTTKIADGNVTLPKISTTGATTNAVIGYNGTNTTWTQNGATITNTVNGVANLSSNTNNFTLAASATVYPLNNTSAASIDLTGMSNAGVSDGRLITLVNTSVKVIVIKHQSASSSVGNRFDLPGGADIYLAQKGRVTFMYDAANTAWAYHSSN